MQDEALKKLAALSVSGDMEAFEELVRLIHGPLFGFLYLLRVAESEIEDIAQETTVRMYRSLPSYRADQPFLPWLRGIAAHVAANYRRGLGREEERRSGFEEYVKGRMGAEDEARRLDRFTDRLRECIGRLQARQREIVELRYFQDFDSARIAARLGVESSAVRHALARVREVLKSCVEASA